MSHSNPMSPSFPSLCLYVSIKKIQPNTLENILANSVWWCFPRRNWRCGLGEDKRWRLAILVPPLRPRSHLQPPYSSVERAGSTHIQQEHTSSRPQFCPQICPWFHWSRSGPHCAPYSTLERGPLMPYRGANTPPAFYTFSPNLSLVPHQRHAQTSQICKSGKHSVKNMNDKFSIWGFLSFMWQFCEA